MSKQVLVALLVFLSCNALLAELHSDSQKAKQVEAALKVVGDIKGNDVNEIKSMSRFLPRGLLYMIDPLVRRQGSQEPMKKPLPGPGFETLEEMENIMAKNPNAEVLPKMSTKFWSKGLKAKLLPVLEAEGIGSKGGQERLLTASEVLKMLLLGRLSNDPPTSREDASKKVKVTQAEWQEIRDQIGELAISYQRVIQSANSTPTSTGQGTHR